MKNNFARKPFQNLKTGKISHRRGHFQLLILDWIEEAILELKSWVFQTEEAIFNF